ncbi:hypothetical protein BFP97_00545 [Roseivirga sp. 4D4]|uniref:hypothetical protein n=1 Tax=Roseivirga sp. 4D4 TaxID=1889784 RepID=UPI00085325FB|nr:hypothetical protein [Roseivirga sp. 4D4]OEK00093.1 hypothetical protein BFP97_00545 [Roseivirga sp. 4D4]
MKKRNVSLKTLSLEIFSIVFAVLLALTLDSWKEQRKDQKRIGKALSDISMEIDYFLNILERGPNTNQQAFDSLNYAIEMYESGKKANFNFGIGRPEMSSLAWQSSKESGITAKFTRSLFLDIAEVYIEYDRLTSVFDLHTEFMLKADPDMSEYTRAKYTVKHLRTVLFRIEDLKRKANEFKEKYKEELFIN